MFIGSEYGNIAVNFDPSNSKTAGNLAKGLHQALCQLSEDVFEQDSDIEVQIWSPKESEERGYGLNWVVNWEGGPYEWGFLATEEIAEKNKHGLWAECYYSFMICIMDN